MTQQSPWQPPVSQQTPIEQRTPQYGTLQQPETQSPGRGSALGRLAFALAAGALVVQTLGFFGIDAFLGGGDGLVFIVLVALTSATSILALVLGILAARKRAAQVLTGLAIGIAAAMLAYALFQLFLLVTG